MGAEPRGRVAVATPFPPSPEPEADVAVLLYTTGTTGRPKGVMLTHGNLVFAGGAAARVRGMGPGDVICAPLPLTHVFGLASVTMAALSVGATLRLMARFDPDRVLEILDAGATFFPGVPQMHAAVMRRARERGRERLRGRLRYASSGGAPLDPAWKRDAEAFYGVAIQNGYGLTETSAGVAMTANALGDPDPPPARPCPAPRPASTRPCPAAARGWARS